MNEKVLDEVRKIIAGFLKQRRLELGLSEAELANKIGFKAATTANFENGKFWPNMKQYLIICEATCIWESFISTLFCLSISGVSMFVDKYVNNFYSKNLFYWYKCYLHLQYKHTKNAKSHQKVKQKAE